MQALFPDNTYGVDSGGDPQDIPKLTFDEFKVCFKIICGCLVCYLVVWYKKWCCCCIFVLYVKYTTFIQTCLHDGFQS